MKVSNKNQNFFIQIQKTVSFKAFVAIFSLLSGLAASHSLEVTNNSEPLLTLTPEPVSVEQVVQVRAQAPIE